MKIASCNINSFGGAGETFEEVRKKCNDNYKKALDIWDEKIQQFNYCKPIIELLDRVNADIVVLQEYYINSNVASEFETEMQNRGYCLYCNQIKQKRPLHTVVFSKGGIICTEKQFFYTGRIYTFKYNDYIIIGAHMPFNPKDGKTPVLSSKDKKRADEVENEWRSMKDWLGENKDKKCILIGDLSVSDKKTFQYKCFEQLFEIGMKDLWVKNANSESTPTEKKFRGRLDYALVTPKLFNENECNISMIPERNEEFISRNWSLSNHRMLTVEIKERMRNRR